MSNENEIFWPARDLAERYGRSVYTLNRWLKDKNLGFPPPDMVINGHRLWKASTVQAWEGGPAQRGTKLTMPARTPHAADQVAA